MRMELLQRCPHEIVEEVARAMFCEFRESYAACFGYVDAAAVAANVLQSDAALPCFVARDAAGRLLGACNVVEDDLGRPWSGGEDAGLWLANLVVVPEHRRRGVGTRLVEAAVEWARSRGSSLRLWCHTRELRGFYERRGFSQVGTIEPFLSHPVVYVMRIAKA